MEAAEKKPFDITLQELKQACCEAFGTRIEDFENPMLSNSIKNPRYAYWLIMREIKVVTLEDLGTPLKRTRQQVSQGIKALKSRMRHDEILYGTFVGIGPKLGAPTLISKIAEGVKNG